jgi:hypothetical protein
VNYEVINYATYQSSSSGKGKSGVDSKAYKRKAISPYLPYQKQLDNLCPPLIEKMASMGVRGLCLSDSALSTERVIKVFFKAGDISKIVQARPNLTNGLFSYPDRAWLGAPGLFYVSGPRA